MNKKIPELKKLIVKKQDEIQQVAINNKHNLSKLTDQLEDLFDQVNTLTKKVKK